MSSKRHAELLRAGYQRQSTYDEPRLSELVQMYRELGFEVLVAPFDPADQPACSECMRLHPGRFKTIYTRTGSPD